LQASRLTELLPFNSFGSDVDMATLWSLEESVYSGVLASKKALFEADAKQKEEAIKLAKEKQEEEKEAIYEIRKKRLEELGMQYSDEHGTFWLEEGVDYIVLKEEIAGLSSLDFEALFTEVKTIIQNAKDKIEKEKVFEIRKSRLAEIGFDVEARRSGFFIHPNLFDGVDSEALFNLDATWFEAKISDVKLGIEKAKKDAEEAEIQKAKDLELAKADAAKLKAENKARIAMYAKDKKALTEFVKSLEFRNPVPELENEDMQSVLDNILLELENTRGFLLTNVNLF